MLTRLNRDVAACPSRLFKRRNRSANTARKDVPNVTNQSDWVSASVMCGTAAGGFMCVIVRLIARPFMSLSDTTPAPNVAGTSHLAAVHRNDRTRSRQRCSTSTVAALTA